MGWYFALWRPAFLPEDLRYIDVSQSELQSFAPQLAGWLKQVFRVMGGFMAAIGLLFVTLAATSFRGREMGAAAGVVLGGLASIGVMGVVNFVIHSDFRWMLVLGAILWAGSLVCYRIEGRSTHLRLE